MASPRPPTHVSGGPVEHDLATLEVGGTTMLHHPESGVLFLQRYEAFRAGRGFRYDERGLNVSVRYAAGASAIVTIYVLPFAAPRTAVELDAVFDASVADMLMTVAEHGPLTDRRTAFAHAAVGVVPGRRCEVEGPPRSGSRRLGSSFVEVLALGHWLLKLRATCEPAARVEVETFLDAWLAASRRDEP